MAAMTVEKMAVQTAFCLAVKTVLRTVVEKVV
jgi:hypothetical protein